MRRGIVLMTLAVLLVGSIPIPVAADDGKESRIKFWGDLRGRFEGFWYSEDATGGEKADRHRIRYRLRLDLKAAVNDHAALQVRLGSGTEDSRSGNQTLGDPVDFGVNEIDIRRAFLIYYPFEKGKLPNREGAWAFQFGRVPVPFVWKNGKDIMLWDHDHNPAGISTNFDMAVGEKTSVFANIGGFVIEEKSGAKDPSLLGVQAGIKTKFAEAASLGLRGSWYYFEHLDSNFVQRGIDGIGGSTKGGGNTWGLAGDPVGGDMQVLATQAYLMFTGLPIPVTAFGGYSHNLDAVAVEADETGKDNIAYNAGVEGGDKKKNIKLGLAWYYIEANAFPSMFIDSDLLDGHTNRQGLLFYFSRQLLKGMDFNTTLFSSDTIEKGAGYASSVKNSQRTRLQVDLVYNF